MFRITVLFGKSAILMETATLLQLGLCRSHPNEGEWILSVTDVRAAAGHYEAVNEALSKFYPFSLAGIGPDAVNWIDLHWRLEMCIANFAVVEVVERERLLFRQIWMESADDASMMASSRRPGMHCGKGASVDGG